MGIFQPIGQIIIPGVKFLTITKVMLRNIGVDPSNISENLGGRDMN